MKYLIITHFENNFHNYDEYRLFDNAEDALAFGEKDFETVVKEQMKERDVKDEGEFDYIERKEGAWGFCLYDKHYYNVTLVALSKNKSNYFGNNGY